jgi:hypothetical protein
MSANQESRTYKYKKELINKKKAHIDGPSSFKSNDIDKEHMSRSRLTRNIDQTIAD